MTRLGRLAPLNNLVERAGRTLLDALYPLECAGCGRSGDIICGDCAVDLPLLEPPFCEVCGAPGDFVRCRACTESPRGFDGVRAPYRYAGAIRQAILALKYGGIKSAAQPLGDMLSQYLGDNPLRGEVLIPVPMHPRRRRERGYNQAELLARRVARKHGLACEVGLLKRTRNVQPQAGITSAARRVSNVEDSVEAISMAGVAGAGVILVDDVATTGSTLDVCAGVLKRAGAASVWGLTLAIAGERSLKE